MSYIICFWDKSKIQVTDEIGKKLKTAWRDQSIKTFELEENIYALNALEKIITKEEAYNVFPAEWRQLGDLKDRVPTKEAMMALEQANLNPIGLKKIKNIKQAFPIK